MIGRLQQHARERLNFSDEVPAAQRLAACKTFLRLESAMIRMHHDAGEPGVKTAQARAAMIDAMLGHLFEYAINSYRRTRGELPSLVALVALGGYGRAELCPLSDVDIMFLYSAKVKLAAMKPLLEHLTNEILYLLWDCGLKVGHSTRTLDDIFVEARKDVQTKTSLLESRLVAGSPELYETFAQAYQAFYMGENPKEYIASRLADQVTRRARYGDTPFLQEPDIKNGVGGLRDFQNALWMARVKLGITTIDELAAQNYLRRSEVQSFQRAYNFLLRVRNELHYMSKRPTDLLDLATQPRLAHNLGYHHAKLLGRVEQFMHDYYRAAQTIHRVSKLIENRLALALEHEGSRLSLREALRVARNLRPKRLDGFVLHGHELAADTDQVFRDDPVRLIRVFRHGQQLDAVPGFHLQALIRESLPLLTKKALHSADANVSFRAIISEPGAVFPTLNLMHELGVLGRFIPEFKKLTCLVQHEFYHRYTADVHTLNAIRELDRIFAEAEPITLKYREALHENEEPELLYLTLLLHDIGKAEGIEGHAESGVRIAQPLLERLQISPESRDLVLFTIKNHLVMARFWQKRDVDDPKTAAAFAELVGNPERLQFLYVHTFCDARATAASLWNGYKDTLHTSLYRATLECLRLGEGVHASHLAKKAMIQQELITQKIPGIGTDEITAHFNLLPERYFIHTDAAEIALHIQMVNRLLKTIATADSVGSLRPIIDWQDDINRSLTVVNVVTWDRAGLFYKLAGAFSVAGLSILSARILSRNDHIAIDTFYVVEPGRGVVQSATAQEIFAKTVESALVQNKDLYADIVAQAQKFAGRYTTPVASDVLHSSFPPTVEVYHELSMQRTIVEIQARDEIGLLYRLAKIIYDQGFDITFARIGTERGIAIDSFYIENANHEPIKETARLNALRDTLLAAIAPAAPEKAESGERKA
jgi:[protein-PII] uridylyltransferase